MLPVKLLVEVGAGHETFDRGIRVGAGLGSVQLVQLGQEHNLLATQATYARQDEIMQESTLSRRSTCKSGPCFPRCSLAV